MQGIIQLLWKSIEEMKKDLIQLNIKRSKLIYGKTDINSSSDKLGLKKEYIVCRKPGA